VRAAALVPVKQGNGAQATSPRQEPPEQKRRPRACRLDSAQVRDAPAASVAQLGSAAVAVFGIKTDKYRILARK
jgi:hypothetical protein